FSISAAPRFLYVVAPWIDALGEISFTRKDQSNDVETITVSPRIGVQLHILSRLLDGGGGSREPEPRQRFDFKTLFRLADQRQSTNTDSSTTSTWTFRDRWTVAYPLNRPKTTSDGAIYLITDIEGFMPLDGGFINELRLRTGPGYRLSFPWKFEWLYIWDGHRSRPSESRATKSNAFYFRVSYQFERPGPLLRASATEGKKAGHSDRQPGSSQTLRTVFPHPGQVDDHLDGLLHVLHRYPFEPRVKIL